MGEEVKRTTYDSAHRREYRRKVQACLNVFETMLAQSRFDSDQPLTGMEIECNLVDADYQPAMSNRHVLDAIGDPAYQTELGAYNIEFNVPPHALPGHTGLDLEAEVRASLNEAEIKAGAADGAHIVMIGILPTLMPEHLDHDWMSESTRYAALNDSIFTARGEDLPIDIDGPEPLNWHAATIAPESACTSMQLHLQLAPETFAANWNAAQIVAGPQLALGANSPFFFSHQLWAETRIELFTQSTDTRPEELKTQGVRPRVWFGEQWITSVLDLYRENIRYFPSLLPEVSEEDPVAELAAGRTRSCPSCGCTTAPCTGGIARCTTWSTGARICDWRIGCCRPDRQSLTCWRIRPSSTGCCAACPRRTARCGTAWISRWRRPTFWRRRATASTPGCTGPGSGGERTRAGARHVAADGRRRVAALGRRPRGPRPVPGVIEGRARAGRNGATWQVSTVRALQDAGMGRAAALAEMLRRYCEYMHANEPVHTWE